MEISTMLTINSAHITKETADILADHNAAAGWTMMLAVYDFDEYGWMIYVSDSDGAEDGMPEDLAACVELAQDKGCDWLRLDSDGEIVDELPVYEW